MWIENKDTTLPFGSGTEGESKILVRSGNNVVFSYSMHSQQTYGKEASEFRPERWARVKVNDPSYIPFHIGPRACPGRKYLFISCELTVRRLMSE